MSTLLGPVSTLSRYREESLYLDFTQEDLDARVVFSRESAAWEFNGDGILMRAAPNVWPLEHDPATRQPLGRPHYGLALTNKVTARKHNPVSVEGLSNPGGQTIVSIVDDTDALRAAGLLELCTNGMVYKIDNSASSSSIGVTISGRAGNLNPHSVSAFWRGAGLAAIRLSGVPGPNYEVPSSYDRTKRESLLPTSADSATYASLAPGAVVYFILPQLVEGSLAGPVIPGDTLAATSRQPDTAHIPISGLIGASEGAMVIDVYRSAATSLGRYATLYNATSPGSNAIELAEAADSSAIRLLIASGGAAVPVAGGAMPLGAVRIAAGWRIGRAAISMNGSAVAAMAPASLPLLTHLGILSRAGIYRSTARAHMVALFPKCPSDGQLTDLSRL
ncbi:hypothetical protein FOZ76_11680 [Verticiella sediminum]|uniref:Uncharacterized protein n=1 Tax=Verticiella sediminum TaxID=1247510 RepID=A0A556APJ0_9BURK|nr:hypothetical protein [Verticiella sediminum]TSH94797.1 hypothetical protein FOZ76_11680 [Verticiella sediminum]